jgi:1-acyl-sn-glycerol-3-phosphate acyltransferase
MYWILIAILKLLIGWKIDLKVEGRNNLPRKGPALIVFNHNDFIDTITILFSIPRNLYAFVAHEYRNNPFVILFRIARRVILIKRGQRDKVAMKKGLQTLKRGKFLVISPEGTRGNYERLGTGMFGPAYLATTTDSPIIPVGIQGSRGAYGNLRKTLSSGEKINLTVKIGPSLTVEASKELKEKSLSDPEVKTRWQNITNTQIMPKIADLLPPDMRGRWK